MSTAAERAAWTLYYHDHPGTSTPFASADGPIRARYLDLGKTFVRELLTVDADAFDRIAGDVMDEWGLESTDESGYDSASKTVTTVIDSLLEKIVR